MAVTGQFLYTITAHNEPVVGKNILGEGLTGVVSHEFAGSGIANAGTLNIDAPGNPDDTAPTGAATDTKLITDGRNIFNRVNIGNGTYAGSKLYYSIILGNTNVTTVASMITALGAGTTEEDWDGTGKALTFHTPSLDPDTYTLIVPTDSVIYQTSPQRAGNVLVWHIPTDFLAVYAKNANLSAEYFKTNINPSDLDDKAANYLWACGYGLITEQGMQLPFVQAPI